MFSVYIYVCLSAHCYNCSSSVHSEGGGGGERKKRELLFYCDIVAAFPGFCFSIRVNGKKILEFLREAWANDRRAEWSIWMVYSKVEMPHHYLSSGVNDSSYHGARAKVPIIRKLTDDVITLLRIFLFPCLHCP